jgi:hypothetical protein
MVRRCSGRSCVPLEGYEDFVRDSGLLICLPGKNNAALPEGPSMPPSREELGEAEA